MFYSVRILIAALGAMALAAQNPLALAADPFSGTFQNEQIKLELTRKGPEYSGVILLAGQSLPVKAKAAAGKLTGTFESGGQNYTFQAVRAGSQITLTTDGTTHVLEKARAQPVAPPAAAPPPAAKPLASQPAFVGEWQGAAGRVRVNADGTAVIGDKSHKWTAEGNVITFVGEGGSINVPFELAGDNWTWRFPTGQLALTRVAAGDTAIAGAWLGPAGSVQINVDGTATVAGVNYRYVLEGNQLKLAGPDGTFVATVQRNGDSMTWVVNGKTLPFQRAATTWALGGAGGILPELVGKWCQATNLNNTTGTYSRSVCFSLLADGSYQYASDFGAGGQLPNGAYGTSSDNSDAGTWTATGDSITSRSKKTGTRTYRLEKRNHPKTGDPMLVLDGAEFTTAYQKAPWK